MIKAIAIKKLATLVIKEAKKYSVTLNADKHTSKLVLTIQKKG